VTRSRAAGEFGPLSFQQEEMVRRLRTFPECARRYDLLRLFDLRGPLDIDCLVSALEAVVHRHAVLRTTIERSGGADMQHVHETIVQPVQCGFGDRTEGFGAKLLDSRYETEKVLAGLPLFRPEIVALGTDHHLLALGIHHLLCDSLSMFPFCRDLSEYYAAQREARPARLPPLPTTYLEFARMQRRSWPADAARSLPFWRQLTDGAPRHLCWPRRGAADPSYVTASSSFSLSPSSAAKVRRLAIEIRVTPFLVLLAATGAALARVTGQDDLLLGTDFANREAPFKQNLVGHFLNTRLIRVRPKATFRGLLLAVRESWLASDDHRDAYLDQVLQELGIEYLTPVHVAQDDLLVNPDFGGVELSPIPVQCMDPYWREILVNWRIGSDLYGFDVLYRPSCIAASDVAAVADEIATMLRLSAE
jgi:hypothetical protein